MKINLTLILTVIILLLIGVGFFGYNYYEDKLENKSIELRKEKIKNDTLKILTNGQARKLVADTLTIKQLRSKIDSLGIELDGRPELVTDTEIKPKDTIKVTDTLYVNEGVAYIEDYYPTKNNFFLKYTNEFKLDNPVGNSKFEWNSIKIDLAISQNKDGTYEANMKAPDFIQINSLDVEATPIDRVETDDFGILLGAGYGKDFGTGTNYLEVGGGVRFKKFYIDLEGNTNKQADIGIKFEF
jgi:hypothetical protein